MAQPPRHGRPVRLLFACVAGAYVAWPCAVLPPLKPTSIPDIVARNNNPLEFLLTIKKASVEYCRSGQLAGRENFLASLRRRFEDPGLSVVVGGKSVGKTKMITQLVSGFNATSPVLYVNMRDPGSEDVMERLEREAVLQRPGWLKKAFGSPLVKRWAAIIESAAKSSGRNLLNALTTAFRKSLELNPETTIKGLIKTANKESTVPVFIIDEANLALPNGGSPQARSFLSFAVSITKEKARAAVILVSSEYGYPYRLEQAGLNLKDALQVIVAPEVEREATIQVLRDQWNMTQELAEAFEEHFGGHLFQCQAAVKKLIELLHLGKGHTFDPYGMLANSDLPGLVGSSTTRKHMENIADKGWSPIDDANRDGAMEIARRNYGAVIDNTAITFNIAEEVQAEMFKGFLDRQVLIPPSKHLRLCIQGTVESQRAKWWLWLR